MQIINVADITTTYQSTITVKKGHDMISDLKEAIKHGTKEYPYEQYNIQNRRGVFIIPAHWHDEMEIIAVERGRLELKINSDEYLGLPGDLFLLIHVKFIL